VVDKTNLSNLNTYPERCYLCFNYDTIMKSYTLTDDQIKRVITDTSNKLFQSTVGNKMYLSGDELLEICPHKQLNKFILFQIYQEWHLHVTKLNSPYFDFKHEEVKTALTQFQNVVSRHIRVEKKDYKTLLDKSVYNNVKLILRPVETFLDFFFMNKEALSLHHFEKYANYFADFDFIVSSILTYHKKHQIEKVEKTVFLEKLVKVIDLYQHRVGHSIDSYRSIIFHKLTGLDLDQMVAAAEESLLASQANLPQQQPQVQPQDFTHIGHKLAQIKNEGNWSEQQVLSNHPMVNQPVVTPVPVAPPVMPQAPVPQTVQSPPPVQNQPTPYHTQAISPNQVPIQPTVQPTAHNSNTPNPPVTSPQPPAQHAGTHPGIRIESGIPLMSVPTTPNAVPPSTPPDTNSKATSTGSPSTGVPTPHRLADQFIPTNTPAAMNAPKNRLAIEQIPMHKQFQYIQKVFAGNRNKFKDTLEALAQLPTAAEAEQYLQTRILNMPEVDREDAVTKEFVQFVLAHY
jgi:hypothetical protein